MASYQVENDIVGTGGLGGFGGVGGSGVGLVILLLLFFAIFSRDGGLFGGGKHDGGYNHNILEDVRGRGPSSCEIEKEILVGNNKIIENQNCLYEKGQAEKLYDAKLKISQLETEKYIASGNAAIMHELCKKADAPHVYARADVQCLQPIPGCGDRRDFC